MRSVGTLGVVIGGKQRTGKREGSDLGDGKKDTNRRELHVGLKVRHGQDPGDSKGKKQAFS